jgi:hypothetical protein
VVEEGLDREGITGRVVAVDPVAAAAAIMSAWSKHMVHSPSRSTALSRKYPMTDTPMAAKRSASSYRPTAAHDDGLRSI